MNTRALWLFYKELFPFIIGFSLVGLLLFGLLWGMILYALVGPLVGLAGFYSFKKHQLYFYFNAGITTPQLIKWAYIINFFAGLPLFAVITSLYLLLYGGVAS